MTFQDDGGTQTKFTYDLENGDIITAQRTNPYGFFYLKKEDGGLPVKYQGAYTSSSEVERAINEYKNTLIKK